MAVGNPFSRMLMFLAVGLLLVSIASGSDRAIWIEADGPYLRSEEKIDEMFEMIAPLKFERIYLEVRNAGDAFYDSQLAARPAAWGGRELDPLRLFLEKTRAKWKRSVQVYAVVNLLRVHNGDYPLEPADDHLLTLNPDWITLNAQGQKQDPAGNIYLDPSLPEVRNHLEAVVFELGREYDLDGIHLTGLRFPGFDKQWGYNPTALQRFRLAHPDAPEKPAPTFPAWVRWRAGNVTHLLDSATQAVRSARPGLRVSASLLAIGPAPGDTERELFFQGALQYWPEWCRQGKLDSAILVNVCRGEKDLATFAAWLDFAHTRCPETPAWAMVSGKINSDTETVQLMRVALERQVEGVVLHSLQSPARGLEPEKGGLRYLAQTVFSPTESMPEYYKKTFLATLPPERSDFPETTLPADLPPPVPIVKPPAVEVVATPSQAHAAEALLGKRLGQAIVIDARDSEYRELLKGPLPEAPKLKPATYFEVFLTNGRTLVGEILSRNETTTVFRMQDTQTVLRLANSRIMQTRPVTPQD